MEFIDINVYIQNSRQSRTAHLNLDSDCIEIGGDSREFRALLAHTAKTTIPKGMKIMLCHACNNAKCSNVLHLYWGTAKDNIEDQRQNGTFDTIWSRMIKKYGLEEAKRIVSNRHNSGAGGRAGKGKKKSELHKKRISESLKKRNAEKKLAID